MSIIEALICGIVQGLTEFLPVSSSGHLAIFHSLLGMSDISNNVTFDIMLHLATLCAVFCVYYEDIFKLIPAFFTMSGKFLRGRIKDFSPNERFAAYIVLATIPLAGALIISDAAENVASNVRAVGVILIINGVLLVLGDKVGKKNKTADRLGVGGALGVGTFQLAAVLPGLSRSGSTITGGMMFGLGREEAVKFSFILSIPAIIGANVKKVPQMFSSGVDRASAAVYAVGMFAAAITGFAALKLIKYIANKKSFGIFAYYCFAAGLAAVIFG